MRLIRPEAASARHHAAFGQRRVLAKSSRSAFRFGRNTLGMLAAGFFALALILGGVSAVLLAAALEEQTWAAHVTDDMCAKEHMMDGMTDPECAIACVEMGAALALFVEADDAVYAVDDQAKVTEFAGQDVTVTGVLSEDKTTVTVHSIEAR